MSYITVGSIVSGSESWLPNSDPVLKHTSHTDQPVRMSVPFPKITKESIKPLVQPPVITEESIKKEPLCCGKKALIIGGLLLVGYLLLSKKRK